MSKALITEDYLYDIADAIRAKNGSADTYTPPQMAAAIAAIPTGSDVDVEPLNVSQNGTYTAPSGKAYSPVTALVPNTYGSGDEGKVVQNGALVAQTSRTFTQNGTYDTTTNDSVTVNVSGGIVEPGVLYKAPNFYTRIDIPQGQRNQYVSFAYDGLVLYYTSSTDTGFAVITANKIDVSEYDTLYIKGLINSIVQTTGQYIVRLGIANSISGYQPSYEQSVVLTTTSAEEQIVEVDISSYTGEYYVSLSGWGLNAEIHEIGLKKI